MFAASAADLAWAVEIPDKGVSLSPAADAATEGYPETKVH
jgi:hypothetical protein